MVTGTYAGLPPEAQAIVRLVVDRAMSLPRRLSQAIERDFAEPSVEREVPLPRPACDDADLTGDLGLAVADHGLRILELETRTERLEADQQLFRTEAAWDERGWENN